MVGCSRIGETLQRAIIIELEGRTALRRYVESDFHSSLPLTWQTTVSQLRVRAVLKRKLGDEIAEHLQSPITKFLNKDGLSCFLEDNY